MATGTSTLSYLFKSDPSDLLSGIQQVISSFTEMTAMVNEATDTFSELGAVNLGDLTVQATETDAALQSIASEGADVASQFAGDIEEATATLQGLGDEAETVSLSIADGFEEASAAVSDFLSSGATLDTLAGFLSQISEQLTVLTDRANEAASSMEDMSSEVESGASRAGGGILTFGAQVGQTFWGIQNFVNMAKMIGGALLEPDASMEQLQIGFTQLLGSSKAAGDYLQQLQQFAAATPFEMPELSQDAEQMIAMGTAANEVIPDLTAIGDAMSALGKGQEDVKGVIEALGQMRAKGTVTAQDMMQLTDRGIPAWKYLADAMGLSVAQVQDLSSKGLLPADTAIQQLLNGMEATFGGGMQKQSQSFTGLFSTLKDNITNAWRAFSGPLFDSAKGALMGLGNVVASPQFQQGAANLGHAIGDLITHVQQMVQFFQSHQAALDGLKAALIGASVAIMVAVVPAFVAWAAAAIPAAIATLVAAAPFIALGAVVALVAFGIIEAIQHWGDIVNWLKGVWSGVAGFFQGIWKGIQGVFGGIGNWFHDRFSDAKNKAQSAWSGASNFFQTQAKNIQNGFQGAANGVVQGFNWMYQHNYYFKNTVDFARAQWKNLQIGAAYDWNFITKTITGALDILKGWITGFWNDQVSRWNTATSTVSGIATNLWNDVKNAFNAGIGFVWRIIKPFWDLEAQGWNIIWNTVSGIARSLWSNITGAFNAGVGAVRGVLSGLWNMISNGWNWLIGQAESWGSGIIQGVINGIASMLGSLGNMASQAASTVASFLGFHSPAEKGPGSELDIWGPNLVKGFSEGIVQSIPVLETAMQQLTQSLGIPGVSPGVSGASRYPASFYPASFAPLALSAGAGVGAVTEQDIILQLDNQTLARAQGNTMMRQIRLKSGGRV